MTGWSCPVLSCLIWGMAATEPSPRAFATASVPPAVAAAAWPGLAGVPVAFVLDARNRVERKMIEHWIDDHRPAEVAPSEVHVVALRPSRRLRSGRSGAALEALLCMAEDPLLAPLRVVWGRTDSHGGRPRPIRELLRVGDPWSPGALSAWWLRRRHPERCRIVVAEPARASVLRRRWHQIGGADPAETAGLVSFVERQAQLALERAERAARGSRFKVPRLVREEIVARPVFRAGVAALARQLGISERRGLRRAGRYLREMAAEHSRRVAELAAYLIHLLYTLGYQEALRYDRGRLESIARLSQRACVVFLPSHRSNLDHLVLQYALWETGHPPNHTAGGINMNFFPIGPLVRRSGVFFIRRAFQDNPIYRFVIRQYVDYLVEKRFSLEWYIEGGRSRTGKLLPPRYGMLAYVVDAWRRGRAEDVWLVPVSIAYDQIQDVQDYAAEQRGLPKQKESLGWFIRLVRSFQRRLGAIHLSFGEPLSLRGTLGPAGNDRPPTEESLEVQKLAFEVAVRINRVTPVTDVSLVTLALLGAVDEALTRRQVERSVGPVVEYVGKRSIPTTGDGALATAGALDQALEALVQSGVLQAYRDGPEPVFLIGPDRHLAAAYYRNTIVHFFLAGAIAEVALLGAMRATAHRREIFWREAMALRDLLKFEFFFPDREAFRAELMGDLASRAPAWERALGEGEAAIRQTVGGLSPLLSHRVLRPLLEAYLVVAEEIAAAGGGGIVAEPEFFACCDRRANQLLLQKRLRSEEARSRALFGSALKLARQRGLLEGEGAELAVKREAFRGELAQLIRRVGTVDALAAARRAGLVRPPDAAAETARG